MTTRRTVLLGLIAVTAGCATVPAGPQPLYFVMRHLHTPAGERDPNLNATGRTAAASLPGLFTRERPAAIYVSAFKRTRQSVAPLAARLGLTPIVYDASDTAGLVARVRAGPFPALIVGHSNTVPDLVQQLGGTRPAPLAHPDFGDLWRIDARGVTTQTRITSSPG